MRQEVDPIFAFASSTKNPLGVLPQIQFVRRADHAGGFHAAEGHLREDERLAGRVVLIAGNGRTRRDRPGLSVRARHSAPRTRSAASPCRSRTRHTVSRSALGCRCTSSTSPTTNPSYFFPGRSIRSNSRPSMVRDSASSSGEKRKSVYCRSQLWTMRMGQN